MIIPKTLNPTHLRLLSLSSRDHIGTRRFQIGWHCLVINSGLIGRVLPDCYDCKHKSQQRFIWRNSKHSSLGKQGKGDTNKGEHPSSLVGHSSSYNSSYHVCKPLELSSTSEIRSVVVATKHVLNYLGARLWPTLRCCFRGCTFHIVSCDAVQTKTVNRRKPFQLKLVPIS